MIEAHELLHLGNSSSQRKAARTCRHWGQFCTAALLLHLLHVC
jgi:hypothetical protein